MKVSNYFKLKDSAISYLPLSSYPNDFTFIVNGQEFRTSRVVADLLSGHVREMHSKDPTVDHFIINTDAYGDFQSILNLIQKAEPHSVDEQTIPFWISIFEVLNTDLIQIIDSKSKADPSINDVLAEIQTHEEHPHFYAQNLQKEFEFVASHFYEINEELEKQFIALQPFSIEEIIKNENLQLKSEDQLLNIINKLYSQNSDYSYLYSYVDFLHISASSMLEFLQLFNINDIFTETWTTLSKRLQQEIFIPKETKNSQRNRIHEETKAKTASPQHNSNFIEVHFNGNNQLNGLINTLKSQLKGNIKDAITITCSALYSSSYPLENLLSYDNPKKYTYTTDAQNSWICIYFNNYRIKPDHYTLRSYPDGGYQVKSWIIEGFDGNEWHTLDEQTNSEALKERSQVHTFPIKYHNDKEYKSIKIKQTSPNWSNSNHLVLSAFELHGILHIP